MDSNLNPNVPKAHVALIHVEVRTGIVLTIEGHRFTGTGERFLFFQNVEEAVARAERITQKNPEIECILQDDRNNEIKTVRNEEQISSILEKRNTRKPWWKLWF